MTRHRGALAAACAFALAVPAAAGAQTPDASPSPAPMLEPTTAPTPEPSASATPLASPSPPVGYLCKGEITVSSAFAGTPVSFGGKIALEVRGSRLRLDIVSIDILGAAKIGGPSVTAMLATQLFPKGGFTIVVDRTRSAYIVWSNAKHAYASAYLGPNGIPSPVTASSAPPGRAANEFDFFKAFSALRPLKTDRTFSMSVALTGHKMLFAHPVSTLHFDIEQTTVSGKSTVVHMDVALADDIDEVPIQLIVRGVTKGLPASTVRIDIPELVRQAPPDGDFDPPAGYARLNSVGDLFGIGVPALKPPS